DLLLHIRENTHVNWSGKHRTALTGQGVYPRPLQNPLPVWLGVGGTPSSFIRAGMLGRALIVAIIGGEPHRFRPLIDRYREAGLRAGHSPDQLKVGIHSLGYVADSASKAANEFFPGYARSFSEIGKERGWPPVTRAHIDALLGPTGALIVGDPETVAEKILHMNDSLGGISRLTFQSAYSALFRSRFARECRRQQHQQERRYEYLQKNGHALVRGVYQERSSAPRKILHDDWVDIPGAPGTPPGPATGENIPAHMKGAEFFEAADRCLRKDGLALVNVCLERKSDSTADRIAAGFKERGWPVRLLDSPGGERNAIVLAGKVGNLRRPRVLILPQAGAKRTGKELRAMRFRRT